MGRRGMCSTFRTFTKRSSRCDLCVSARSGRGYNFKRLIAKKSPTGGVLILSICVAKILADSDQKCRKCPPILLPQKEKRSPPPNETPVSNVPFKPPHQSNFHWRHRLCCHIWGRQKKPMRHLDQHAKRDVEVAHWGRRFLLSNNYKNNVSEACDFVGCPICAPVDGGNFDFFTCATFFFFYRHWIGKFGHLLWILEKKEVGRLLTWEIQQQIHQRIEAYSSGGVTLPQ